MTEPPSIKTNSYPASLFGGDSFWKHGSNTKHPDVPSPRTRRSNGSSHSISCQLDCSTAADYAAQPPWTRHVPPQVLCRWKQLAWGVIGSRFPSTLLEHVPLRSTLRSIIASVSSAVD